MTEIISIKYKLFTSDWLQQVFEAESSKEIYP